MKITEIRTMISWAGLRNWVLVKVMTDKGLYGWGEATLEHKETTIQACIQEIGAALIGEDPLASEFHWQTLYRHGFWRGGVVLNTALAGLDQAFGIRLCRYGANRGVRHLPLLRYAYVCIGSVVRFQGFGHGLRALHPKCKQQPRRHRISDSQAIAFVGEFRPLSNRCTAHPMCKFWTSPER